MVYKSFQESLIWQKSEMLMLNLSRELLSPEAKWLRDLVIKAALTCSQFIAKGYEKNRKKTLIQHLKLAKDQLTKIRSMLSTALHMNFMSQCDAEAYFEQSIELSKLIQRLIRHLSQANAQSA